MPRRISMTEKVTNAVRLEITSGVYQSDTLITEIVVSEKYGVSKTPAREALNQLCAEGLLEKIPHKGYLLKRYSAVDLENLIQFRYILEINAVEIAIQVASNQDIARLRKMCDQYDELSEEEAINQYIALNRQFHIALSSLAKNPFITAALANTLDQLKLALSVDVAENPGAVKLVDHKEIVEAIAQRNVEQARALVGRFVDNVHSRLPDRWGSPRYF